MKFQLSGDVSDESQQAIGQKLGAQTIITGSIKPFGRFWRLSIRVLSVKEGVVQGIFNKNISGSSLITDLTAP